MQKELPCWDDLDGYAARLDRLRFLLGHNHKAAHAILHRRELDEAVDLASASLALNGVCHLHGKALVGDIEVNVDIVLGRLEIEQPISELVVQRNRNFVFKQGRILVAQEQVQQPVVREVVLGAPLALDKFCHCIANIENQIGFLRICHVVDDRVLRHRHAQRLEHAVKRSERNLAAHRLCNLLHEYPQRLDIANAPARGDVAQQDILINALDVLSGRGIS